MASSIPKPRRATATFQGASPVMKVPLDSRVIISRRRAGTVRYVGRLASDTGEWYGIALDEPKGDNDGSWDKERYFQCAANHGVFVRRKEIFQVKEAAKCPPSPGAHDSGDDSSTSGSSTTEQQDFSVSSAASTATQAAAVTPLMRTFKSFRKQLENITIKTIGGDSTSPSSSSRPASPAATAVPASPSSAAAGGTPRGRSGLKEPQSRRYSTFTLGEPLPPSLARPVPATESAPAATQSVLGALFDQTPSLVLESPSQSPPPSAMPLSAASRAQSFVSPPPPPSPSMISHPALSLHAPTSATIAASADGDASEEPTADVKSIETVLDLSTLMEISETLVLDGLESGDARPSPVERSKSFLRRSSDSSVVHQETGVSTPPSPPAVSRTDAFVRRNSDSTVAPPQTVLQLHEDESQLEPMAIQKEQQEQQEQTQVESLASPRGSLSSPRPMFLRRTNIGSPSRLERRASFASGSNASSSSTSSSATSKSPPQRSASLRIAELEREIYTMRSNHENVIAVLRATNQQHAANVLELRAQVAALTEGNNYLERQLASKLALLQELQQMDTHDRVTRDEVARVMALKDAQIQALEKEIAKLKQHVLRVETERDSQLCQQFRHLSAARERDEERIAKLRQDVVHLCNERMSLQSELHDLKEMTNWF